MFAFDVIMVCVYAVCVCAVLRALHGVQCFRNARETCSIQTMAVCVCVCVADVERILERATDPKDRK